MSWMDGDVEKSGSCAEKIIIFIGSLALILMGAMACKGKTALISASKAVEQSVGPSAVLHGPAHLSERLPTGDFVTEIVAIMLLNDQLKDERIGAQLDQDDIEIAILEQKNEVKSWDKKRIGDWLKVAVEQFDADRDGKLAGVELAAARSTFISRILAMKASGDNSWKNVSKPLCADMADTLSGMKPKGGLYVLYERVAIRCVGITLPDGIGQNRVALCQHIQSSAKSKSKFSYLLSTITANCAALLPVSLQKS